MSNTKIDPTFLLGQFKKARDGIVETISDTQACVPQDYALLRARLETLDFHLMILTDWIEGTQEIEEKFAQLRADAGLRRIEA